jgi:hypothetical protein
LISSTELSSGNSCRGACLQCQQRGVSVDQILRVADISVTRQDDVRIESQGEFNGCADRIRVTSTHEVPTKAPQLDHG